MRSTNPVIHVSGLILLLVLSVPSSSLAQGSIFGSVTNSDLSTPANGEIVFIGYLDDTDEEIRIEISVGAGYDNGNWYDDFQNYLTEAPGNPYDYIFFNTANNEGFQLSGSIPNNSFQQEDVTLSPVDWPATPTGLTGVTLSGSAVVVSWHATPSLTYHVYRRVATSDGSLFRLDNIAGLLTDPGVVDSFFVDSAISGASAYDYIIVAEGSSGNWSMHSAVVTVNSAVVDAPVLSSIHPATGNPSGGTVVDLFGSGFDPAGVEVVFGAMPVSATVLSPFHLSVITPPGAVGPVDVSVINSSAGQNSNTLVDGFLYATNARPVLDSIGPKAATEGILLEFATSASDLDGSTPSMTTSALPDSANYIDNGDGTALFSWTPSFSEAGIYYVTFFAVDSVDANLVDSEVVEITVENVNLPPVLDSIGPQAVDVGMELIFGVKATDPDGVPPSLDVFDLPAGARFVDHHNGNGAFDWRPSDSAVGEHILTFVASDGFLADSERVIVIVNDTALSCCVGMTGNIDGSVSETPDIGDLQLMIDHLFIDFEPLGCIEEADVDLSGQPSPDPWDVDIGDLQVLIEHLYISFDPLPMCPQ